MIKIIQAIAVAICVFSCSPDTVCGEITDQYQTIDGDIIWVINDKAYEISKEMVYDFFIGDSVCFEQ